MPANTWYLFDRIREFARSNRIYSQQRPIQDQPNLDRLYIGGGLLDSQGQTSAMGGGSGHYINRLERYRDYDLMDQTGEIALALDMYSDEISLIDPEHKHSIVIRANSKKVKLELEELFFNNIMIDKIIRPMSRYLCKYGCCPYEIVPSANRDAVASLRFLNVYNFSRVETKYGDLIGFFHQDELVQNPIFLHPWACLHLRLTSYENPYHPHGRSVIDPCRGGWKRLRLMEDAALIYRLTRAPEKRKYKIPVGNIAVKEVPEYMRALARQFKRQRFYNPSTGTFDEKYSPMVQEDDYFLPQRPDGTGPDIDILPGAENLDQIADIEYFKKKMVAPLKIPYARLGIGEGSGESSEKSLSQSDAEFAKAVKWIQAEIALGLMKVAIVHLALRGYTAADIKGFEIALASSSALEDLYRMETWQSRVSVIEQLKEIGYFPKEWIITRFTDLSPDEILDLKEMESQESGVGGGGGGGLVGGGGEFGDDTDLDVDIDNDDNDSGDDSGNDSGNGNDDQDEFDMDDEFGLDAEDIEIEGHMDDVNRLLLEEKRQAEAHKKYIITKLYDKQNKITNPFNHLLESNELDGLSKGTVQNTMLAEDVVSMGIGSEIIIARTTSDAEASPIIKQIREEMAAAAEQIQDTDEIDISDLPD